MVDDTSHSSLVSTCVGCSLPITDQYIYKVSDDLQWHEQCLKCCDCNKLLNETCYVKHFKPYCKDDYLKNFSTTCSRCKNYINRKDMIIKCKSNIYHFDCFNCDLCNKKFMPGDEFQLNNNLLICKNDLINLNNKLKNGAIRSCIQQNTVTKSQQQLDDSSTFSSPVDSPRSPQHSYVDLMTHHYNNTHIDYNSNDTRMYNDEYSCNYMKDDEVDTEDDSLLSEKDLHIYNTQTKKLKQHNSSSSSSCSSTSKPARIRTVLNEKQLQTLRSCYLANPRPDSIMKEHLVETTGLTPRVIRVWFQNKRCKDKKKTLLIRHDSQHQNMMYEHCF